MNFHVMWLLKKVVNFFKTYGENEKGKYLPETKVLEHFEDK